MFNDENFDEDLSCEISRFKVPPKTKLGKLVSEVYNPDQDLVALGYEHGTVVVKRVGWKTCWKRELANEVGIYRGAFAEPENPDSVDLKCLCWSPDGEVLVASMADGRIHMMWAQCGKVAYTFKTVNTYRQMKWVTFGRGKLSETFKNTDDSESFSFANSESFNFNEEATKHASTAISNLAELLLKRLPSKFINTVLVGVHDSEVKVDLYACGIMYFRTIDAVENYEFGPMTDVTSVDFVDCSFSHLCSSRLNIAFKVFEYDSEVLPISEDEVLSEDKVAGISTFVTSVNLGYDTHDLWTVTKMALLYSKLIYLMIFFREMCQYTFARIDEKTGTFYEQSLNEMARSYKVHPGSAKTTFFHEIVRHLIGKKVTVAFSEVLKKSKSGQCVKILEDFCYTKMKNFGTGMQHMSMTVDVMRTLIVNMIDIIKTQYFRHTVDEEMKNSQERELLDFYADIAVLQTKLEEVAHILNEKKERLTMLHTYFTEMMNTAGDENHLSSPVNLEDLDPYKLLEFLGESLVRDDVRIPKGEMYCISGAPIPEGPRREIVHELIKFMKPIGFYHLPAFVPVCAHSCPHSFVSKTKENTETEEERKVLWDELVPKDFEPMVSVYSWHNEKCFDYLCKYFPEYSSGGFPPESIVKYEKRILSQESRMNELYPDVRKLLSPLLPSFRYLEDEDIVWKLLLRPTVFLAMLPVFKFEDLFTNLMKKFYPAKITKTITKLEQSNSNEGPIKMRFLDDISTVEKVLGIDYCSFVDGSFYVKKIEKPPESDEITDQLIFIPKTKKIKEIPKCEAAVLMIHKNCTGRIAFIFQNYNFEFSNFPIFGFVPSPIESKKVLWKSGSTVTWGEIQVAEFKKENSLIIGILKAERKNLFYYCNRKRKFYFSKLEGLEGDFESMIVRPNGSSFVIFDQGKSTGLWIQPKLITVDELRGKWKSQEIVSKEEVEKALSSAVPMDYVFPGLADFFKDVHEYHLH